MGTRRISVGVLAVALLAACGGGRSPAAPALPHVRISVLPFLSYAPLFIAEDEGLFRAHGVDVELVSLPNLEANTALAQGDVDCVSSFLSVGLLNMIERGAGIRVVADKGHAEAGGCAANGLLIRRDLIDGGVVKGPRDLKGLRLDGYPGTVEEFWIDNWLAPYGLRMDDMSQTRVPLGAKLEAFRRKKLDVIAWSEPFISQAVREKIGVLYASPDMAYPHLQWAVLMYGPRLAVRDRALGQKVMDAYLEGVARYNLGKTDRNVTIVAKRTQLPEEVVRQSCWLAIRDDGMIDLKSVMAFQAWAVRSGLLARELPADQVWDPSFIQHAAGGGG